MRGKEREMYLEVIQQEKTTSKIGIEEEEVKKTELEDNVKIKRERSEE